MIGKRLTYFIATSALLLYIATVFFCCLYDFSGIDVNLSEYIFGIRKDRLIHFTMFLPYPLIAWFFFTYNGKIKVLRQFVFGSIIISGLFLASFAEASQELFTTWRDSDPFDLGANITGILIGTLAVYLFRALLFKICNAVLN